MIDVLDLFCGGGGSSTGLAALGLDVYGIDFDTDSIATHEAAGHKSQEADIATLTSVPDADQWWISAPCTAFSAAGKRKGVKYAEAMIEAVRREDWRWGRDEHDPTVWLSLASLEMVIAHRPKTMVWENVELIRPLFDAMADVLRAHGYRVGVWLLRSEQWGVAQTRKRLFMAARLCDDPAERAVPLPEPAPIMYRHAHVNHAKIRAKVEREGQAQGLGKWVSMAEALGWEVPAWVGFPRRADTPSNRAAGDDTISIDGVDLSRDLVASCEPAKTLTEKARSWNVYLNTGRDWKKGGSRNDAQEIGVGEPCPTLSAVAGPQWQWRLRGTVMENGTVRPALEPAMTLGFGKSAFGPGSWSWESDEVAIRKMTIKEAARLQAFPDDHPFTGSLTSKFRQIGNAVPPPMALVTMGEAMGIDWRQSLVDYLVEHVYKYPVPDPGADQ